MGKGKERGTQSQPASPIGRHAVLKGQCPKSVPIRLLPSAYLLGVDETTFVTSVALERAQATIADHERTVLTAKDREVVLAALDNPAPPTDALREAMAMYAARVVQGH